MGVRDQGIDKQAARHQVVPRTLVFIRNTEGKILFLKGATGKKIWPDLYNGVGGHIEAGETIIDSARREIEEETGFKKEDILNLQLCGIIHIDTDQRGRGIMLFVFTAESKREALTASREGSLHWLDWKRISPEEMPEDLPFLLSKLETFSDFPFYGRYWYNDADQLRIEISEAGNTSARSAR